MHLINDRDNYPKNKQYSFVCSRSSLTNSFLTAELTPAYRGQVLVWWLQWQCNFDWFLEIVILIVYPLTKGLGTDSCGRYTLACAQTE